MGVPVIGGVSGVTADVNAGRGVFTTLYDASGNAVAVDTDKHLQVVVRPQAFGSLGAYSLSMVTGAIIATGSANAVIWTMRWTDATRFALIERVRVAANVQSTITTAVPYDLALYFSGGYTVSPTTSIAAATVTARNAKRRTSMGVTLLNGAGAGIWALTTVAAGITGQTLVNDAQPLARISGNSGTVVGTQFFGANPTNLWDDNVDGHPLILAQNEGITIQAPLAGPATGTFMVGVSLDWMEVAAY